jgi:thymidylate synthase
MSKNIEHQYLKLLKDILDNGVEKQDRTGTGTISVFGRQIRHKMSEGFPLLTTKKMAWKSICAELLWFLRGDTNIKYLVDNGCHIWDGDAFANYYRNFEKYLNTLPEGSEVEFIIDKDKFINKIKTDDEFAEKWGELGPIYGKQWRSWVNHDLEVPNRNGLRYMEKQTIDQIENSINLLKTDPDSRRNRVSAWNVGELDQMTLPPCHTDFQFYTRELSLVERLNLVSTIIGEEKIRTHEDNLARVDKLNIPTRAISLMWNQRSVDTFLGLPFNIASYGLLLEIIAKAVNMVPDELIGNLGDVHLYSNHIEQAREQLTREPYSLPKININTEWWPTESGECGEGPLDAMAVLNGFSNDDFCKCLLEEDIQLGNYQSHPTIKAPLSN